MKIVTSIDSLNAVEAMVNMLEAREWAEHAGVCDVTRRLETCITTMHNEIAQKNAECNNYETENRNAVEFLGGQADGLGQLASEYRNEIWRLRDGINTLLNERNTSDLTTAATTERFVVGLRALVNDRNNCCPPLQEQIIVTERRRFDNVWDALEDTDEERDDMKERARLMKVIRAQITERFGVKEFPWLAANVGFSQSIWEAIYSGHIDELEQDVLVQLADMLSINIIPGQCELKKETRDENLVAKIAHGYARSIVVAARAMNQTGLAERYMVPQFKARFKITNEEWHILEAMNRQKFLPEGLSIPRLYQIANDGDVNLPVIELDD